MTTCCPTWIGSIGFMSKTPCIKDIAPVYDQRAVFGGGEGTLSPRRARVNGTGARTWQMTRDVWLPEENSVLFSLSRRQQLHGGTYRVIPCDATDTNMMTPHASEELRGWTNVEPTIAGIPPMSASDLMPVMAGIIAPGTTAVGPTVPLPLGGGNTVYSRVHVSGTGTLRLRSFVAGGTSVTVTTAFSGSTSVMVPVKRPTPALANHHSCAIEVVATTEVRLAWPSIAYADTPYVTGRGCDAAFVSVPERSIVTDKHEGFSYVIVEVGL